MPPRRPRTLAAATLACLTLSLGACGDDSPAAAPATPPPASAETPSSSATPTPTPPADETAEEFIRRWVEVINRMQRTGDTKEFRDLAGPDCSSCKALSARVDEIYRSGGKIEGGDSTVVSITPDGGDQWRLKTAAGPSRIAIPNKPAEALPGGDSTLLVYPKKSGQGGWRVGEYLDTP